MERLLQIRKQLKKKKPKFLRQDAHKRKKLEKKWRSPKGMHSKMRKKLRGYRKQPSIGYSSPKKVRHLTESGLKKIIINNIKSLSNINPKTEVMVLAKTVGLRKKVELLKKAKEMNIKILNVKDIESFLKNVEEKRKQKKAESEKKEKEKQKVKEEALKKAEEKEKKEKPKTEEEKKVDEKETKEEKRKVLEKK